MPGIVGYHQRCRYVTKTILLDNFKTAVKRADRYEPAFTDLCNQLAEHYNTTFSATRPASPTDKAMVEKAVNIVYTHIYARLRNEVFHSIESLNHHIRLHLDALNRKPYKNSSESRLDIFIRQEQPVLKTLPSQPYQVKKGKQVTVQTNYAIQLPDNKHYYTVPYRCTVGENKKCPSFGILCRGINGTYAVECLALITWNNRHLCRGMVALIRGTGGTYTVEYSI